MKTKINNLLFYSSIMLLILSFDLAHNTQSGWQKQELPELGGITLSDIYFIDSLTGWAVTGNGTPNDTGHILKTTNGGFNWSVVFTDIRDFNRIIFLNENTGFVCGGLGNGAKLYKTIDGGSNWTSLNVPGGGLINLRDMSVLNEDTIWVVETNSLVGGIFLTTNGGANWTRKYYADGLQNPDKIYFFDKNLGFAARPGRYLRTTDGGDTWSVTTGATQGFYDIHFTDSLTGWIARNGRIYKSIDGGLNWYETVLPSLNDTISSTSVAAISGLKSDSIMYAVGPRAFHTIPTWKGLILKSTDRGENWGYQLPDTNKIKFKRYTHIFALDANRVWAYQNFEGGLYTNVGGDTTYYTTSISQVGTNIPADFILHQNFPNPFNPLTKIRYELKTAGTVKLKVYDIRGREVSGPVDETQHPGIYEVNFSASEYGSVLSSGVYFYSLFVEDQLVDTKKMLLLK